MRTQPWSLGQRGVSPIVGEVLMIAVVVIAMSAIAWTVISSAATPSRYTELRVRLENASSPPTQSIRVVLFHRGGDPLGIPTKADDEFRVFGSHIGENSWENVVAWNSWTFSAPANGFELGENAVGTLRHDNATIRIGDKVGITIMDLYSDKIIYDRTLAVEDSRLYA
ncbi:MAG: type IV pilin N-terminal domain-containing protein [Hadesarchaea archaeon]|nr:type IV pilin N-terminal domain-containing protein [Hadesarchaea archaeon]